jgi:Heat shock protein
MALYSLCVPLEGTPWRLISYDYGSGMVPVLNGTTVTAEFSKDQVAGSAGCNHYFGSYTATTSMIRIEGIGMTEMYCTAPGVMEQEDIYLTLLGEAQGYTVREDTLQLLGDGGKVLLIYQRVKPLSPLPLENTNWTLESFISEDAASSVIRDSRITAVFASDGRVGGTAGCNQYFAAYTRSGSLLSISGIGSTKMYCTTPEGVMGQENQYLNTLALTKFFTIEEDRLILFGANEKSILAFRATD